MAGYKRQFLHLYDTIQEIQGSDGGKGERGKSGSANIIPLASWPRDSAALLCYILPSMMYRDLSKDETEQVFLLSCLSGTLQLSEISNMATFSGSIAMF